MAEEDVSVRFGAQIDDLISGVNSVKESIASVGETAESAKGSLQEIGEAIGIAFSVEGLIQFVENMSELGEQAIRSSEMLGVSVENVQKLGFAAQMTGGSAESMTMMMMRLERNMAEAGNTSSKSAQAFAALGVSEEDIKGKSPDQVLGLIADAFKGAADGAGKTAIAMDLMGRRGAQMIPLLNEGSDGLEKMGIIAEQTGSILDHDMAEGFEKTKQGLVTLHASVTGTSEALFEELKPAVDGVIVSMTQFWQSMTLALSEGGVFHEVIAKLVTIFEMLVGVLETVTDVLGGMIAMVAEAPNGLKAMGAAAQETAERIKKNWSDIDDIVQKVNNDTKEATKELDKGSKPSLVAPTGGGKADNSEEKNDIAIEKSDAQTKLELYKLDEANKKMVDQEKVDSGQMSNAAMIADLRQSLATEQAMADEVLQSQIDSYDEGDARYEEAINKKKVIDAQYYNQLTALDLKAAAEQKANWKSVTDTMSQAFDTMINGVLQGTQTWKQAMGKLFSDLALKFIDELCVKLPLKWLDSQIEQLADTKIFTAQQTETAVQGAATQTAAVIAGVTAQTTAQAAGAATGIATQKAAAGSAIGVSAKQAAAAVYADVAQIPYVGWLLAPPAAAAAFVAVEAFAGFETGTDYVPQTGLALLHQGEAVIPASQNNGPYSGASGGGGQQFNININAIDTQSGASFLKNNAHIIAQTLANSSRNFSNNAPGWKS